MQMLTTTGNLCLSARRFHAGRAGLALFAFVACLSQAVDGKAQETKRRITVKDTIEMTEFADRGYFLGGTPSSPVAIFSPDKKRFVIRLKKGDIERNEVEYSLLLFQTNQAFQSPVGQVLVTMSSSSNREAIQQVRWLDDRTVTFLGEKFGNIPQVYRFGIFTKRLARLTHHPTAVVSYDISRDGREIVYEAASPPKNLLETEQVRRRGWVVTSQYVSDLLAGGGEESYDPRADRELFVQIRHENAVRIPSPDFLTEYLPLELSPDGRFAILAVYVNGIPNQWEKYEDIVLRPYVVEKRKPGTPSNVQQYMLVDVQRATIRPLLDAPKAWLDEGVAWSGDGRSVMISGTFLPLGTQNQAAESERKKHPFVAAVEIPSQTIHVISGGRLFISHWDDEKQRITLKPGYGATKNPLETFQKVGNEWRQLQASVEETDEAGIDVTLEEDRNTPPKIFVKDRNTGEKSLLLDLNPQFRDFALAIVQNIKWKATDGHEVLGGLYFPPGYEERRKYPLVIQTHGYEDDRFWMNGPWNSAFAAQPLAAKGNMVLQIGNSAEPGEDRKYVNTPAEGPRRMAAFEGAIDELDRRGLIDRDRVGIIGFSRTAFHVAYTLTHSTYRFRAATMADGFEGGYLNYLLWRTADYEGVNGGEPVGTGLKSWLENSPGFRIDAISAPVRIEDYGPHAFLGGWEWYSVMSLLGKPVDFIWIPRGTHLLVKPWERLTSQQGNVDWFQFWLESKEDPDPAKADQYVRWRELRKLEQHKHEETEPTASTQMPPAQGMK
jgi:dipeptidyl aminopeptidase/acylaminoacyl peptidase